MSSERLLRMYWRRRSVCPVKVMRRTEHVSLQDKEADSKWPEDGELIQRLRSADEAALGVLMNKYSSRIMSSAQRILRSRSEAEEVTQDVFWALWRDPDRFEGAKGPLITWLVIVARSRALDRLRRIQANLRWENELASEAPALRPHLF